jgi:hypothetical protein
MDLLRCFRESSKLVQLEDQYDENFLKVVKENPIVSIAFKKSVSKICSLLHTVNCPKFLKINC